MGNEGVDCTVEQNDKWTVVHVQAQLTKLPTKCKCCASAVIYTMVCISSGLALVTYPKSDL